MAMILRDYQQEAVSSIYQYFETHPTGNPVVAMPTGTGKSLVIAGFLKSIFEQYWNQKILCLTHVKELIEQNYDKTVNLWPMAPAGIYSAGLNRRDTYNNIIFAGIGSVANRADEFEFVSLIIIDEAHLLSPNQNTMYRKFIDALLRYNPRLRIIGLTATPYRIGQGHITSEGGLFTDVCFDITGLEAFNRLIAEYYLCPLIPRPSKTKIKYDEVPLQHGEFVTKAMQKAFDQKAITESALKEAIEGGGDRKKWLIFTTGIEHTNHTAEIAQSLGINCVSVHSKLHPQERDERIAMLKAGEVRAVANNNILTTGFDDPEIDFILVLRSTNSPGLWVQMLGRGTRPVYAPGYDLTTFDGRKASVIAGGKKNTLVMDYGGNTERLGPINDPLIPKTKKKGAPGTAPVKQCPVCDTYNHASVRFCIFCENEFIYVTKLRETASGEELIKGDIPITETFKVDHITYAHHSKLYSPDSIKVTYYCGNRMFNEFLCFEHSDKARTRSVRWWQTRNNRIVPDTTSLALDCVHELIVPTHIKVWTNKKYPEVMLHCFDGSAFGEANLNSPYDPLPTYNIIKKKPGGNRPTADVRIRDYIAKLP